MTLPAPCPKCGLHGLHDYAKCTHDPLWPCRYCTLPVGPLSTDGPTVCCTCAAYGVPPDVFTGKRAPYNFYLDATSAFARSLHDRYNEKTEIPLGFAIRRPKPPGFEHVKPSKPWWRCPSCDGKMRVLNAEQLLTMCERCGVEAKGKQRRKR